MTRRMTIEFVALILVFGFALRVPYFFHVMQDIDEGSHAAVAAILMDGGLPYANAVNNKPPGIFYIYLATFYLFGKYNMTAVHMLAFFWTVATGIVLGMLAKNLWGKTAGLFALLFYLTFTTALYPKMMAANSEIFMALPYSLAVLLLWHALATGKGYLFFFSGLMSGLALLIKQVAGVEVLAVSLYILVVIPLFYGKKRIFASVRDCVKYWAGFVLPVGIVAWIFYKYGILADQVFWNVTYPQRYIGLGSASHSFMSQIFAEFVPFVLSTLILWVLATMWIKRGLMNLSREHEPVASHFSLFLILWLIASMYAAFIGNRMYGDYFIQILPALSLMAAIVAGRYFDEKGASWGNRRKAAILVLTILPGIVFTGMAIRYEATTDTWGGIRPDFRPATDYIKAHTRPEDKIFVWGWFTPIYVYSRRTPSTRFVFTTMHTGYMRGHDPNEEDRADITWLEVPEAWPMLKEDLNRNPPELIVDTSPGNYHDFGRYPLKDYPILRGFVEENCRLEIQIGGTNIYRCRGRSVKQ